MDIAKLGLYDDSFITIFTANITIFPGGHRYSTDISYICNVIDMSDIIDTLHREGCSCVIACGDSVTLCRERGVADLLRLLDTSPATLKGAAVADKVVGKGAAALMMLGGVKAVYADVVSRPALDLFAMSDIDVGYGRRVDNIINRAGTGICPVESLCAGCRTAADCLPLIRKFIFENSINHQS